MPAFHVNNWYWKQYTGSTLFDLVKKWRDYTKKEQNLLLYGAEEQGGKRVVKQVEGIHNMMSRLLLKRDRGNTVLVVKHDRDVISIAAEENKQNAALFSFNSKGACPICSGRGNIVAELVFMDPVTTVCEACGGNRYSDEALSTGGLCHRHRT